MLKAMLTKPLEEKWHHLMMYLRLENAKGNEHLYSIPSPCFLLRRYETTPKASWARCTLRTAVVTRPYSKWQQHHYASIATHTGRAFLLPYKTSIVACHPPLHFHHRRRKEESIATMSSITVWLVPWLPLLGSLSISSPPFPHGTPALSLSVMSSSFRRRAHALVAAATGPTPRLIDHEEERERERERERELSWLSLSLSKTRWMKERRCYFRGYTTAGGLGEPP